MKNLIYLFVLTFLMSSCTENIDFDLNSEKSRLVVEGEITTGKAKHVVKLTQSTSYYYSEEAPLVTNAAVSLSDGTNSWTLTEEKPGYYYTPEIIGQPNLTYTLSVNDNGTTYSASDFMVAPVIADSLAVVVTESFDQEKNILVDAYSLFLFVEEPVGLGDNYIWKYWLKTPDSAWKNMTPNFEDWVVANDEYVDGNAPEGGWELFADIPLEEMPTGTQVRLEMYKISTPYYDFLNAIALQTQRSGFFDGPPANIPGNISEGALGFFSSSAVDSVSTVVK